MSSSENGPISRQTGGIAKQRKVKVKSLSHVQPFGTPWAVDCQAPPSMGFSRQEYWSGLPFLSPGDLPNPGIKPGSPTLQADSTIWATREAWALIVNQTTKGAPPPTHPFMDLEPWGWLWPQGIIAHPVPSLPCSLERWGLWHDAPVS